MRRPSWSTCRAGRSMNTGGRCAVAGAGGWQVNPEARTCLDCHARGRRRPRPPGGELIELIRAWALEPGAPPRVTDWTGENAKWDREYLRWPSRLVVTERFGPGRPRYGRRGVLGMRGAGATRRCSRRCGSWRRARARADARGPRRPPELFAGGLP